MNFRQRARDALARAKAEMASNTDTRLHYAALELRMAIECVTYERAMSYEKELPPKQYDTWQPSKLMNELLEIDPDADASSTLAIGIEDEPGKSANVMRTLGAEKVFDLSAIKKSYDALGSYLHQPTLKQMNKGGHDLIKAREKCERIARQLDEVLSSQIFNINLGIFASFQCTNGDCARIIRKRMPRGEVSVVAKCVGCGAEHEVIPDGADGYHIQPLVQEVMCANPSCGNLQKLFRHEVQPGTCWTCIQCSTQSEIVLAVFERVAAVGVDASQT